VKPPQKIVTAANWPDRKSKKQNLLVEADGYAKSGENFLVKYGQDWGG
jgi:hypothetical protein